MNSLSEFVKNYLIVTNSADYLEKLFKLCLEHLKTGCTVVILTSEIDDFSNLLAEVEIDMEYLKNVIIMSYKTIDDICRKLLFLHSWALLPSLVVVDLHKLLSEQTVTCLTTASLMQKVTLCTVSLLTYLESIATKLRRSADGRSTSREVNGLLILRSDVNNFGDAQIQTLKDLYFYKTQLYQDLVDLRPLLLHESED
ncbi:uncharacterized protein LOC135959169 [Calliphora vicina]|uniref:uncharacterized protein LOC135959169 n=1 Tax=Calliphora vicina TaxID=7373 RepID=UPI00325AD2A8